ncbi:hypothetical protein A0H81_02347 [Grifola frondosa]|uniref:Uncharacterized protein n=1 Tax=Grifola frondosa TaxID=5627 RepID=A0A1C7MMJ0_GRIFR|nr:hypothetical protein A0H81_02347 [Grifola frondosa]
MDPASAGTDCLRIGSIDSSLRSQDKLCYARDTDDRSHELERFENVKLPGLFGSIRSHAKNGEPGCQVQDLSWLPGEIIPLALNSRRRQRRVRVWDWMD